MAKIQLFFHVNTILMEQKNKKTNCAQYIHLKTGTVGTKWAHGGGIQNQKSPSSSLTHHSPNYPGKLPISVYTTM